VRGSDRVRTPTHENCLVVVVESRQLRARASRRRGDRPTTAWVYVKRGSKWLSGERPAYDVLRTAENDYTLTTSARLNCRDMATPLKRLEAMVITVFHSEEVMVSLW
jgi:hypothetical protein